MIPKICAIALISVILSLILKEFGFKSKALFSTLCLIILIILAIEPMSRLLSSFGVLTEESNMGEAAEVAVRAVGIGYVFGFTSDICSSLGENHIASMVEMLGKFEIFLLALPYFEKTVALGIELLG